MFGPIGLGAAAAGEFDCQRDVNCPEGTPYQVVKRAVAESYDGRFICTVTLINNVRQDGCPYILTAAHCQLWQKAASAVFYWRDENSGCGGKNDAPLEFSTGAESLFHARGKGRDLNLLKLDAEEVGVDSHPDNVQARKQ